MNKYECAECGAPLEDYEDVLFMDRAFLPSGAVFCDEYCLLHYLGVYYGSLSNMKSMIKADEKYPDTYPEKLNNEYRTKACSEVKRLAKENSVERFD